MCIFSFFSRKQPSFINKSKEQVVIEDTIKLAMRPWKDFVSDYGSMGVIVATPMTNIVSKAYIPDLASAMRVANLILHTAQKESDPEYVSVCMSKRTTRTDNGQFFHQSAVNFLASVLYYFVHKFPTDKYGDAEQVDLPHVLAFLQLSTNTIFEVLETCEAVRFAMLPFNVCYRNKSFDQLDAMMTTAMVDLAPLATPENFWMLSYSNTNDRGEVRIDFEDDPFCVLRNHYLAVQKDVRDYADYLLGIREKPIETTIIDNDPIPDDIQVIDEPYAKESEEEHDILEPYSRMMLNRFGYESVIDSNKS